MPYYRRLVHMRSRQLITASFSANPTDALRTTKVEYVELCAGQRQRYGGRTETDAGSLTVAEQF